MELVKKKIFPFALSLVIALSGGILFSQLHIILPWLLGPMFAVLLAKAFLPSVFWPAALRNAGLICLGLQLGSTFTKEVLGGMIRHLPLMGFTSAAVIGFTVLAAHLLCKYANITLSSAAIGSFPGGLSQMVVLSEEIEDADEAVVTFMQTFRIIFVISAVPYLTTHFLISEHAGAAGGRGQDAAGAFTVFHGFLLFALAVLFIYAGKKIKMPIPYLLGPMLAGICLNAAELPNLALPDPVLAASQVAIGAHLGRQMKISRNQFSASLVFITVLSNAALILFCFLLAFLFHALFGYPVGEIFLGVAPGGIAEMAITAMALKLDVSFVTSFHLFRIFVILFIATPLTVKLLKRKNEGAKNA